MSSGSPGMESTLGTPITCEAKLQSIIHEAMSLQSSTIIQIESILGAPDDETWANRIMLAMIHNLSFDGSVFGQFGTPDRDIKNAVIQTGLGKNLWVKLLGIKMRVLILQLDKLDISIIHKDRIRQLDQEFKKIFPARLPASGHTYRIIF